MIQYLSDLPFDLWERVPQKPRVIKTFIVLAVALTSVVVAPKIASGQRLYLLLFALIPAVVAFLAALRWPGWSVAVVAPAALFIPYTIQIGGGSQPNSAFILIGFFLGVWLLDMFIMQRKIWLAPSRPVIAALCFLIAAFIGFGFGQLPWFPAHPAPITSQIGGLLIFILSVGAFLLAAHRIQREAELQAVVWVFVAAGLFFLVLHSITRFDAYTFRIYATGATGSLFYTWLAAILFSQALFNTKLDTRVRLLLAAGVLLLFYDRIIRQRDWVSGWLPALAAIGVIIFLARPRLGIFLGAGAVAALILQRTIFENTFVAGDNEYSMMTRLEAWRILFAIFKVNPITGLGPANYYWYTSFFPILGWYVPFNSHNNYMDILAQTGLLGMACFLIFVWVTGVVGLRLVSRVSAGFQRAYMLGALGGLAGTLVAGMLGDWVIPFVYNVGIAGFRASFLAWLFLGGMVALEQINRGNQTT